MANPICTDLVCDTTTPAVVVPTTPVPTPTCGLATSQVYTNATIHTNASGCISYIESGDPFLYTPDPCCPTSGTGTGGSTTGLDGPAGPAGPAATIAVGSVTTGAPGSAASVVNVGTANAAIFNMVIPAGAAGADGATPTGLDFTNNGLIITDGLVQQMPSNWPPVMAFNPPSVTADGFTLVFTASTSGEVTPTFSAASFLATYATEQAQQDSNIVALTTSVATTQTTLSTLQTAHTTLQASHDALQLTHNTLQTAHDALQTAHDTLKARVDAAGIP